MDKSKIAVEGDYVVLYFEGIDTKMGFKLEDAMSYLTSFAKAIEILKAKKLKKLN